MGFNQRRNAIQHCGILHALPKCVGLFNRVAFPKVMAFLCSYGAFDVNVSVFNISFLSAFVSGLIPVRSAEMAYQHLFHLSLSLSSPRPNRWAAPRY
jgi:hypothetical protein